MSTAPEALRDALGQVIAHERRQWQREREAMQAEMRATIEAAAGKLPPVEPWRAAIYRDGRVVTHAGAVWQAIRDTASEPPHEDWRCIVAPAATMQVCGTWNPDGAYRHLDVVALNGASFVARHDNPGSCPGDGWQLLAAQGKRAARGAAVVGATLSDVGTLTLRNADGTSVRVDLAPIARLAHG